MIAFGYLSARELLKGSTEGAVVAISSELEDRLSRAFSGPD